MKQVVSFDKLKLTNNQLDDNGHVSQWKQFLAQLSLHLPHFLKANLSPNLPSLQNKITYLRSADLLTRI